MNVALFNGGTSIQEFRSAPSDRADSICGEQTHLAERELSSFLAAVTELYGPEQARSAKKVWLDELNLMNTLPLSTERSWRAITIAASARLARRVSGVKSFL